MKNSMQKIKVVLIDDDPSSIQLLSKNLVNRDDIIVCGTADNLEDGSVLVKELRPDILFLDMHFPSSNGLEWYENTDLPANTKVVFHTCYQRYIHDALSLKVFDFLLKPFDPSELEVIINRYKRIGTVSDPQSLSLLTPMRQTEQGIGKNIRMRPLAITSVINSKIIVNPDEIVYFRYISDRKIWECVFSNLKRIILKRQTTAETILGYGSDFVRTHKQYIVNIRYVGIISGSDVILIPPLDCITEIKISKSYRSDLMDRFYAI